MRNKAEKWVFEALMSIRAASSFPIIGIDSDNWSEFINWHLLRWCEQNETTFTRSRSGNSNDGAHVKQKNWAVVRTMVGYHRYDTFAELLLLNKIWALQSMMTNYFSPQQKLISKVRNGAKVTKKYDKPKTPHRRATAHDVVDEHDKQSLPTPSKSSIPRPSNGRSRPSPANSSRSPPARKDPAGSHPQRPPPRAQPPMSQRR